MFKITGSKGFHITFENGYTVSVQFGGGNYCDNYDMPIGSEPNKVVLTSSDAEVAVWKDGSRVLMAMPEFGGDTVGARYSPKQILDLLIWAESQSAS